MNFSTEGGPSVPMPDTAEYPPERERGLGFSAGPLPGAAQTNQPAAGPPPSLVMAAEQIEGIAKSAVSRRDRLRRMVERAYGPCPWPDDPSVSDSDGVVGRISVLISFIQQVDCETSDLLEKLEGLV